jgi:hypothetical protein
MITLNLKPRQDLLCQLWCVTLQQQQQQQQQQQLCGAVASLFLGLQAAGGCVSELLATAAASRHMMQTPVVVPATLAIHHNA